MKRSLGIVPHRLDLFRGDLGDSNLLSDFNLPSNAARSRPSVIPSGSWPRRMPAEVAAAYVGERTVKAFMRRIGTEYPQPRVAEGRRKLWLKDDLDHAILPRDVVSVRDVVEDL